MRLITVLNRCTTFKRFVFEGSHFDRHGRIMVRIRPRKNSRGACSGCGHLAPTYDTAPEARLFEFVPLWGFPVFLVYRMRRVACKACGRVVVEKVPWSTGKHHLTDLYRCFLAQGPKNCRGSRWRVPSGPVGTRSTTPSSTSWTMGSLIAASTRSRPSAWMKSSIVRGLII